MNPNLVWVFLLVIAVAGGLIVAVLLDRRGRVAFRRRFPPISDAEFLARCTPGTNPRVALRVRRIVAENLGVDYECIYPSTRFDVDPGAG
jgi:hypothetical protein